MQTEKQKGEPMSDFGSFLFGMMTDMNKEFARQFQKQELETEDGEVVAVNE